MSVINVVPSFRLRSAEARIAAAVARTPFALELRRLGLYQRGRAVDVAAIAADLELVADWLEDPRAHGADALVIEAIARWGPAMMSVLTDRSFAEHLGVLIESVLDSELEAA